ncbi:spore germination protein YndF [Paenibacillus sp. J31TS4]|uniref:Ger(x)C family spore germination protein n=1 Tax=Paenibacillus sp. J31TS4 TaxID=2807195 RepID=UPI001B0EA5DF|nr:Ger(x)C family spore germination protein [Paenibacillus sp. J31TS4]GIP37223.1 spore germination protein YndF [Paenibacillus sp. J31TS4]
MAKGVKWGRPFVFLLLPFLLGGCWSSVEPQDITYVTAIGIDHKDQKFTLHVQVLGFSNIAKQESGALPQSSLIYVAKAVGSTLSDCFNRIYETAQQRIVWGHTSAVVLTEGIMREDKLEEVMDYINRYPEFRYNMWLYGTRGSLEQLFMTSPLFHLSPLHSLLHEPTNAFQQRSLLPSLYLFRFIEQYRDPGTTTLLPILGTSSKTWTAKEANKEGLHEMQRVDGAFIFRAGKLVGSLSTEKLEGIQWVKRKTNRYVIGSHVDGGTMEVALRNPRKSITAVVEGDQVYFDLHLQLRGELNEMSQDIPYESLRARVITRIEQDLRQLYSRGLAMQADLLGFEEALYRQHVRDWKRLGGGDRFLLRQDSLRNIRIDLQFISTGKYQYRSR